MGSGALSNEKIPVAMAIDGAKFPGILIEVPWQGDEQNANTLRKTVVSKVGGSNSGSLSCKTEARNSPKGRECLVQSALYSDAITAIDVARKAVERLLDVILMDDEYLLRILGPFYQG